MSSTDVSWRGPTRASGFTSSNGRANARNASAARAADCNQGETRDVGNGDKVMSSVAPSTRSARPAKRPSAGEYTRRPSVAMARVLFAHGHLLRFDRKQHAI